MDKKALFIEAERRGLFKGKDPALVAEARRRFGIAEEAPMSAPPKQVDNVSILDSIGHGAAQGATLGFQDELSPYAEKLFAKLDPSMSKENYKEMYGDKSIKELRDEYRDDNKQAKEQNPMAYLGGELVGGIAPSIVASPLARAKNVATATAMGAGTGLGYSEAEDLKGKAIDTGLGAGLGFLGGKVADKFSQASKKAATDMGRRSLGFNKALNKAVGGIEKAENATNVLLNETDVIGPRSIENMGGRVKNIMETSGKAISSILKQADDQGVKNIKPLGMIERITNAELKSMGKTIGEVAADSPEVATELQKMSDILERRVNIVRDGGKFAKGTSFSTTFEEAQYIKKLLGNTINWKEASGTGNIGNDAKKLMYHTVTDYIDEALGDAAEQMGNDTLKESFLTAKRLYSASATADRALKDRISRDAGNKLISLTDWVAAGAGAAGGLATGTPTAGSLALVAAKKGAEKYGLQTGSKLAYEAAKLPVDKAATFVGQQGGKIPASIGEREDPSKSTDIPVENMGKYSGVLQQAKQQGPEKLAQAHYVLYRRDPEYQKLYNENKKQEEGE